MYEKPLSKAENAERETMGVSRCEYRYRQACAWALLMGEAMPNRVKFEAEYKARHGDK